MKFNLKRAVETLAKKDLKFIQPMYEAITNSLEADATEILIDIQTENLIDNDLLKTKVVGFSITDNGVGFTEKNRDSFLELWSEAKLSLGCKGSGRFTWLNVFENIFIESEVSSENKLVKIPFYIRYNDEMDITGQTYMETRLFLLIHIFNFFQMFFKLFLNGRRKRFITFLKWCRIFCMRKPLFLRKILKIVKKSA